MGARGYIMSSRQNAQEIVCDFRRDLTWPGIQKLFRVKSRSPTQSTGASSPLQGRAGWWPPPSTRKRSRHATSPRRCRRSNDRSCPSGQRSIGGWRIEDREFAVRRGTRFLVPQHRRRRSALRDERRSNPGS